MSVLDGVSFEFGRVLVSALIGLGAYIFLRILLWKARQ